MSNFNSFSPKAGLGGQVINIVEGDKYPALKILLKESNCSTVESEYEYIDLGTVESVTMYFREVGTTSLIASIDCTLVPLDENPYVILEWPDGVLDGLEGRYEGEIETTYKDGSIVTVYDLVNFNIRKDFSN